MQYNGWNNKETWLVNLWLGDMLQCDLEDGIDITPDYIETLVDEMTTNIDNGLINDLLNCALGSIDYYEIAKHYETESV